MIINMYTDGSVRPHNPGPGGFAAAVWVGQSEFAPVLQRFGYLGDGVSNNQAEYMALIAGLDLLLEHEIGRRIYLEPVVRIHSDSMLVVNHVNRRWRLRSQLLRPLFEEAQTKLAELRERFQVQVVHVKGHRGNPGNEYVDKLAGQVVISKTLAAPRYTLLLQ